MIAKKGKIMQQRNGDYGKYPTWKWISGGAIGIIILLTGFFMGGNINDSKADARELRVKLESTCDRVTKLETNYEHIIQSLAENKEFVKRTERVLIRFEKKNGTP